MNESVSSIILSRSLIRKEKFEIWAQEYNKNFKKSYLRLNLSSRNDKDFDEKDVDKKYNIQEKNCNICTFYVSKENMERDHIQPRCFGGDSSYENLQILCKLCHDNKTSIDMKMKYNNMIWRPKSIMDSINNNWFNKNK